MVVNEFIKFYQYLNCMSFFDFCQGIERQTNDYWAQDKWKELHSDIGQFICNYPDLAEEIYKRKFGEK